MNEYIFIKILKLNIDRWNIFFNTFMYISFHFIITSNRLYIHHMNTQPSQPRQWSNSLLVYVCRLYSGRAERTEIIIIIISHHISLMSTRDWWEEVDFFIEIEINEIIWWIKIYYKINSIIYHVHFLIHKRIRKKETSLQFSIVHKHYLDFEILLLYCMKTARRGAWYTGLALNAQREGSVELTTASHDLINWCTSRLTDWLTSIHLSISLIKFGCQRIEATHLPRNSPPPSQLNILISLNNKML